MHKCSMTVHKQSDSFALMLERWDIAYLEHVTRVTNKSISAIAKDAGLSSTTLTRPISDPDNSYFIKTATLDRVKGVTGIDYHPFAARAAEVKETSPPQYGLTADQAEILRLWNQLEPAEQGFLRNSAKAQIAARDHSPEESPPDDK